MEHRQRFINGVLVGMSYGVDIGGSDSDLCEISQRVETLLQEKGYKMHVVRCGGGIGVCTGGEQLDLGDIREINLTVETICIGSTRLQFHSLLTDKDLRGRGTGGSHSGTDEPVGPGVHPKGVSDPCPDDSLVGVAM